MLIGPRLRGRIKGAHSVVGDNEKWCLLMPGTFVQAAAILLREGLEALLVIAALAAYLNKSGASDRLAALYGGAVLASLRAS